DFEGGSQATATIWTTCSGVKVAGPPGRGASSRASSISTSRSGSEAPSASAAVRRSAALSHRSRPRRTPRPGGPVCGGARREARVVGECEQDADPARQADAGGLAAAQLLKRGALAGREGDAGGTRAAHEGASLLVAETVPSPCLLVKTETG